MYWSKMYEQLLILLYEFLLTTEISSYQFFETSQFFSTKKSTWISETTNLINSMTETIGENLSESVVDSEIARICREIFANRVERVLDRLGNIRHHLATLAARKCAKFWSVVTK